MVDLSFLATSDAALFVSLAALVYVIMNWMGAGAGGAFENFFPVTLSFLGPIFNNILLFAFYGSVMILAVPYLLQLGFSMFLVLAAGLAYFASKTLGWPMEQSIAFSILAILVLGIGF